MSSIRFTETGSNPTDSPDGQIQMYAKTDGKLYVKRADNTAYIVDDSSVSKGKVLQVTNHPFTGTGTSASTSYVETGLTSTMTPTSTSSKILVQFHLFLTHNGDGQGAFTRLSRSIGGATATYPILNTAGSEGQAYAFSVAANGAEYNITGETISMSYLDSPSTTSAVEYNVEIRNLAVTTKWNSTADGNYSTRNQISFMTLMEIAG